MKFLIVYTCDDIHFLTFLRHKLQQWNKVIECLNGALGLLSCQNSTKWMIEQVAIA